MNRFLLLPALLLFALNAFGQRPVIKFTGSASICAGKSLELTVDGAAGTATFKWRKDAILITPAETGINYTATASGTYDVIVTTAGIHDTLPSVKVTVNPNPVSNFTFSPANQCSNLPVTFNNTSAGTGLTYSWTFGDPNSGAVNNVSDDKNPSHTFIGNPGNATQSFNTRLIATDNKGCKDTATASIAVKQVPGTQLDGTGYTLYNGLPYFTICNETNSSFEFINISSTKATNTNYQVKWGDASPDFNSTTFNAPINHDYGVGKHVLQFIVTGANGCKDTAIYNVFVGSNPAVGLGNPGNTIICSGTSLTFPISSTASNPPGTVYTVTFNDGTPSIIYNHPAPNDVTHRFDEGSCGISSQGFSNSFSATIVASNPCATSAAAVVPIYVSKKGVANFSISPKDTTCVNAPITVTNTGTNASVISSQGQCIPGKSVWQITPATGWSTTGNLGNATSSNPALWTAGDNSLNIVFNTPGVYTIKLKTGGNSLCGGDEAERTICVNPVPVAAFTTNVNSGCLPLTVTTTNTSNTPNCGKNTYNWTVSYSNAGGCDPGVPDFDYINGTSASSATPQFRFNNAGVYTLRLVTTSPSSNCASVAATKEITVKAKPSVTMLTPATVCQNSPINPTATVNNCYSATAAAYAWTFTGGLPASSALATPGNIVYTTAGPHTISLTVTNECGPTTVTKQIIVKPTPAVIVPANQSLCAGVATGALTFTSSSPGTLFTWTNNNTSVGLPANGTGNIASFTALNPGTVPLVATITVTPSLDGCTGPAQSFTLTVTPKPTPPIVTGPVSYCQGGTAIPLMATAGAGNDLVWYTTATGGTGSSTAPTPATTIAGNTNYYVSQINTASGCESARASIAVTVNTSPKITGSSFINPALCASPNGSITLNGLTANTSYHVKYNKNSIPVSANLIANANGVLTIPGLSAGAYSNVLVILNGCPSNEAGPFVLTDPNPPATPTVGSNSPVCSGGTLDLVSGTTSTGALIYSWTGPNGFTSNQQNPSVAGVTTAASGDYTVTVTLNGCSASGTVPVVVNPKPSKPLVDRPVFYCLNAVTTALTGTASAGNTLTWYDNKELNNGVATAPVPMSAVAGTVFYYVTQTNPLGCISDTSAIAVTVYPLITGNTIGTNQILCAGSTAAPLTGSVAVGGGNASFTYQWQVSTDNGTSWTDIENATTDSYSPGVIISTTKYRRLTSSGPCTNNTSNVVTITIQGTLSNYAIAASQIICEGSQPASLDGQLPLGGSGVFTYQWESSTDNNNWTLIPNTNSLNYQPAELQVTTYYKRKTTSGSCSAYSPVVTIDVNLKPVMKPVADVSYCHGSSGGNISFGSVPSPGIVYSWVNDNPSIGLAASGNGNIPVFTATNDLVDNGQRQPITARITVTPAFDNGIIHCAGDPLQFTITVLPFITPLQVSDIPVCSGITIPFYTPPHVARDYPGSSLYYHWSVNGNSIDLTNGSGKDVPAYTTINTGNADEVSVITLTATYVLDGVHCAGGQMSYPVIVKPGVTNNSISGDQNICENTSAAILKGSIPGGGDGGYKYQWQSSTDGGASWNDIITANEVDYDPGLLIQTTKFRRSVHTNLCTAPAISNIITINTGADAKALFTSLKDTGCAPFVLDASVINLQRFPQNNIYNWYANGNFIGAGNNFPGYTINNTNDSVTIKLVALSGCKADSIENKFYTYLVPVPSFTLSDTVGCGPLAVTIHNTTPAAALFNYHWDLGNGHTSTAADPGTIVFAPNPLSGDTTYFIKLNVVSVCDTITIIKPVRVKAKPKALFAPGITAGCSPMTVVFNNTSAGRGNNYDWDFGDGTVFKTTTSEPVSHVFTTGIRDTFYVKLKATNECGVDSSRYAIVVSPNTIQLDFAVNGNEETGCSPHIVKFINNSKGASSFTWNFGDGNIFNSKKNIDTVTHVFQTPGEYVITLHASNGCSDTTSTETIIVYPIPKAAFAMRAACLADTVRFTNLSEGATSYQWQFGDGSVSTEKSPNHKYQSPGAYNVVLKAFRFNDPGSVCTDSVTQLVQLGPSGTLGYTNEFLCNNRAAAFQVQTTNADTLIFNFGDGKQEVTTNNTAFHVYANAGIYLPSVTLKNKAGCAIVLPGIDSIKVDKIKGGFLVIQQQLCGSTSVNFSDTSHAFFGIASRHWNFGDGTTATAKNVSHTYTTTGTYPVELIVMGNSGCSDTIRQSISVIVNTIPVATVNADAISCVGYTIPFTSTIQSGDAINILQWSTSNGVTNNGASFNSMFSQAGDYTVRLIAGTIKGCYDTVIHNIRIHPSPAVRASNDVNICLGNDTRLNATSNNPISWSPAQGLSCVVCPNPVAAPLVTTSYVVQTTNNFGCSGYDTVIVTVIQPLQLTVSADDSICIGQSANLLASGASSYAWSPATGLNNTSVSNPVATPVTTNSYRVVGYDGFNCFTDTAYVLVAVGQYPTINLGPDLVLATGTLQPLNSVVQNGPVREWNWTPVKDLSCPDCPLPVATIKKDISYVAEITNYYGCSARDTIAIKVFCENSQVFIANAFTPDNDGINDVLLVQGKGIVQVKSWRIFNRWGEMVFERSHFSPNDVAYGWDGKVKGIAGGPDVFVFTAEVICENGAVYSYKGNVSILK